MKRLPLVCLLTTLMVLTISAASLADVETSVQKTLKMEGTPIDLAISSRGRWIFVLTDEGNLLVYSSRGVLQETIPVGESMDGIEAGPSEDIVYLRSQKEKSVQIVNLDFIQNFNITDSPFKGPADAPVMITVFSDFQ